MTRAKQGDRDALEQLLRAFSEKWRGAIAADIPSRLQSMIDADDVLQVTSTEAFLKIEQCRAGDADGFFSWLRQSAKNDLRDAIKCLTARKRAPAVPAAGDDRERRLVEELTSTSTSPSGNVRRAESVRLLHEAVDRLPPSYGQVIRLVDLGGSTPAEAAAEMGMSVGAVHMMRQRAKAHLRGLLGTASRYFTDSP